MKRAFIAAMGLAAVVASAIPASPDPDAPPGGAELFAPGVVSTEDNEFGAAFTPDGREVYFTRTGPTRTQVQVILFCERRGQGWSEPRMAPFSGRWKDLDPSISPDGKRLVFASNRPGPGREASRDDYDLWAVERSGSGWGEPFPLGAVNSVGQETTTSLASDGTLYLASDRPGGKGRRDLYTAKPLPSERGYGAAEPIAALNTDADDSNQYVAADQSWMIFASDRPGGLGQSDFYVSYRRNGEWTAPTNLGEKINDAAAVLTPTLTPDGKYLVFASFRGFADKPLARALDAREFQRRIHASGNGLGDLYRIPFARLGIAPAS